jgi:predicted RNase H-like nuclease (RuvC/YqgF family)
LQDSLETAISSTMDSKKEGNEANQQQLVLIDSLKSQLQEKESSFQQQIDQLTREKEELSKSIEEVSFKKKSFYLF